MLFKSRKRVTFWGKLSAWFWPRRSFLRSLKYLGKRFMRISAHPHALALGLAVGVFTSCTPFLGFHIILAILLVSILRANLPAALIGTAFANPLTIPLIFGGEYAIGHYLLSFFGHRQKLVFSKLLDLVQHHNILQIWDPVIKPMLIGCLILGNILAFLAYTLAFAGSLRFQKRRKAYIAQKHFVQKNPQKENNSKANFIVKKERNG